MKKKIIIVILMFLVIFVSIAKASLLDNILLPFQFLFEIIFPSSPEILEAKIEPIKVEPSDWMIITAEVKDKYGIESVKADMAGIEIVDLKLISGNENEGIYQASWFVHSVEVGKTYNATIIARNIKGKESFFVLQFHDDPVFCCRINISNLQFFPLSPRIIGISLDTTSLISQGKMRSDCGDIRFTDSKAFDSAFWTRNFSYRVSGCNSANTIFYVEVPSGVTSFYAYYGNPQVTSISNSSISGFTYRIPIIINNTQNSNTLTDYQILVTINTQNLISQGKMRNDCGDIRFTDSDGSTLLNYWIESGCNTTNTKIWVKVPNIPANSNKTIYLYYGNSSADSISNGDDTFLFFDDFEGTSLNTSKWNVTYPAQGSITVSDGYVNLLKSGGLVAARITMKKSIFEPVVFELKTRIEGAYLRQRYGYLNSSDGGVVNFDYGLFNPGYNFYWNGITGIYWQPNVWYRHKAFSLLNFVWEWYDYNSESLIISRSATAIYGRPAKVSILAGDDGNTQNGQITIDFIFVRKYTSPEPTISIGNEEITATLGSEETWIRISGGGGNLLITGGGGTLKIK